MRQRWIVALALLGALAIAWPAQADYNLGLGGEQTNPAADNYNTLAPGATFTQGIPPGQIIAVSGGFTSVGLNGIGAYFSGSFKEAVYKEAGGTYDFLYQITNNNTSQVSLAGVSTTNYGTTPAVFSTSVGYSTTVPTSNPLNFVPGSAAGGGTINPVDLQRSPSGAQITFSFVGPNGGTALTPGSVSDILFIRTNATSYDQFGTLTVSGQNTTGIVNPGSVAINAVFEPSIGPVPEPSSIVMGGTAASILAGFFGWRRRKA
jgi:hypothetical protein